MYQRQDIREGMRVRGPQGERLGRVFAVGEQEFHVEKGLFFPQDYACAYSEIDSIRDDVIVLQHGRASLHISANETPYADDLAQGKVRIHVGDSTVRPGRQSSQAPKGLDSMGLRIHPPPKSPSGRG